VAINPAEVVPNANFSLNRLIDIDDPDGLAILKDGRTALVVQQEKSALWFVDLPGKAVVAEVATGIGGLKYPFEFIPHVGDSIELVIEPDESVAYVSNARSKHYRSG
jgi:hypothetical protein